MALVDTRFNSYQPNLTVLASNNVIKLGSVISIDVKSTLSPGNVKVEFGNQHNFSVQIPVVQTSAAYETFSVTENPVYTLEDSLKISKINPKNFIVASVPVNTGQVTMNVLTVVVEQDSKVYGYRMKYRNNNNFDNNSFVIINDRNVEGDRKPIKSAELYVYVKDGFTAKTVRVQRNACNVATFTTRTAIVIGTKIKPVNVIDESIPGSGGGGGGGGGGAGVLTEYWS